MQQLQWPARARARLSVQKATLALLTAAALAACEGDLVSPKQVAVESSSPANAVAPGSVADLAVASKLDTAVTLSFTQVTGGDGSAASYEVRMSQGPMTWWLASAVTNGTCASPVKGTAVGATMSCTVTGLKPSTAYSFQVVPFRGALNLNATFGLLSGVASATTLAVPPAIGVVAPGRVADLAVASATDTSATLRFTQVSNGAGAPASYEIRMAEGAMTWWLASDVTRGTCASPVPGTAIGAQLSCTVTGLKAGTAYSFQLVAFRGTLNKDARFGLLSNVASGTTVTPPPPPAIGGTPAGVFFSESFNDASIASRGWYDNTSPALTSGALTFHWSPGAQTPSNGGALRHKFANSNSMYVSYDVKYSDNFIGSGKAYHPHEFYALSTWDDDWGGLSNNWMTLYLETAWSGASGRPRMSIQDNKAVNTSFGAVPRNLIGITEDRSVGGCNGVAEANVGTECWAFQPWYNLKQVTGPAVFQPTAGAGYKAGWNHVEAYYQLNSIRNGVTQNDGVMQLWFNGQLVIDRHDIVFRTAARATLQLNQFVIAPYIGDGSPVDQTMWIDNLVVAAAR